MSVFSKTCLNDWIPWSTIIVDFLTGRTLGCMFRHAKWHVVIITLWGNWLSISRGFNPYPSRLIYWMFLCVLIMSQVTMATTTPPVTCVLWSITHHCDSYASCHLWAGWYWVSKVWYCCHSWFQGAQWGVLKASVLWHGTTTSVPDAFAGICQLCHGSTKGKFLFQSWASQHCVVSLIVCDPCQECTDWLHLSLSKVGRSLMLLIQLSSSIMVGHRA